MLYCHPIHAVAQANGVDSTSAIPLSRSSPFPLHSLRVVQHAAGESVRIPRLSAWYRFHSYATVHHSLVHTAHEIKPSHSKPCTTTSRPRSTPTLHRMVSSVSLLILLSLGAHSLLLASVVGRCRLCCSPFSARCFHVPSCRAAVLMPAVAGVSALGGRRANTCGAGRCAPKASQWAPHIEAHGLSFPASTVGRSQLAATTRKSGPSAISPIGRRRASNEASPPGSCSASRTT